MHTHSPSRLNTSSSLARKRLEAFGSENSNDYNYVGDDFDADIEASLSLSVRAADAVLHADDIDDSARSKDSAPGSKNGSSGSLKDLPIKRNGSDKNFPDAITKTTNMTNFYYKKSSKSDEKLNPN